MICPTRIFDKEYFCNECGKRWFSSDREIRSSHICYCGSSTTKIELVKTLEGWIEIDKYKSIYRGKQHG